MKKLTINDLNMLGTLAQRAARSAGRYIQSQFDGHYTKDQKSGGDSLASQVVTEVDLKAQEIILECLKPSIAAYDLGLLTEESADDQSRTKKPYFWCIDPMDGTLPFTERRTGYAVSIALVDQAGSPVIGVAYIPDTADCFSSIKGEGVRLNNEAFIRNRRSHQRDLNIYMDISLKSEPYYHSVMAALEQWAQSENIDQVTLHADFGGVRNALSVMQSETACYFKFPKPKNGCGSIWDYAATSLFFEEMKLYVSNAKGEQLHLNDPSTTFMNPWGIIYTTDRDLALHIVDLNTKLNEVE